MRPFALALAPTLAALLLPTLGASPAEAQNPAWPNRDATPEDLMDPANWPDDPGYGYDIRGGDTCIGPGMRCWDNRTGGQWNQWSWIPPTSTVIDGFREEELELGAGTWNDMAWTVTIGDPRVVIAVLDSGIEWEQRDLVNQHFINRTELEAPGLDPRCLPEPPAGHEGDPVDVDGDGFLTMRDWFAGKTAEERAALEASLDGDGNRNGVAEPGDLIVVCSDGVDDDDNGYVDDISGWDFLHDDNDPNDDTRAGHGTGEARDSAGEGNNGIGDIGFCPRCRVLMVRVADDFVGDSQDYAQGVIFAVDSGATLVQEALGGVNHTTFMRRANDYAYANDVLVVASAADENSRHHNMPATSNHTLYVHANRYANVSGGGNPQAAASYLVFNNCTNYGGQLALSAPGTACSSEAVGVTSGVVGMVYSAGLGEGLDPPLSAEEVRQLVMTNVDDIDVPESRPGHPDHDPTRYFPSRPGWDQRFGYGRLNTYRAVSAVRDGRIPPEVDVVRPDWFRVVYPDRTPEITIEGSVDARRAGSFDWVVEWAPGIEPEPDAWTTLASADGATERVSGVLARWDVSDVEIDNPGEVENRFTVTVRIRAMAHYGGAVGDVPAEGRRVFAIHRDPALRPGFPVALGVAPGPTDVFGAASGEGSPKMVDVDGDGSVEIVYGDADGMLHVFDDDGTELPGYPVQLGRLDGLDPDATPSFLSSRGYASGEVPAADVAASILATAAVGDLDGDGALEIVAATLEGRVYALHAADGSLVDGFPVTLPAVLSGDTLRGGPTSRDRRIERAVFASPVLADLDDDGRLEIIVAAWDSVLYVFRHDGTEQPGFPITILGHVLWTDPDSSQGGRIMTTPGVGDVDGDGQLDIVLSSNEEGDLRGFGAVHVIHGDGALHEGGAWHDNWPAEVASVRFFPVVGVGIPSSIPLADVDLDGVTDLGIAGTAGRITLARGRQPPRARGDSITAIRILDSNDRGPLSNVTDPFDKPLLNTFATGSFGDLDADGYPDFLSGGAGLKLGVSLGGGGNAEAFSHQIGAWSTNPEDAGDMLDGFPQRIEDYLFFMNPTAVDVNGDDYPEVVVGSGGYYMHAWDACGREAEGWPKFVGGWIVGAAAFGDTDGDGLLEVAMVTRAGYLWLFDTEGPADGAIAWPEFRHDNRNTGNLDMPLSNGGSPRRATERIRCPTEGPDVDAGAPEMDAGAPARDAGPPLETSGGGCGCRAVRPARPGAPLLSLPLVVGLARRRRASARRAR